MFITKAQPCVEKVQVNRFVLPLLIRRSLLNPENRQIKEIIF